MDRASDFIGLTPYLHYENAGAMLEWLTRVFGFEELARYVDGNDVVREAEMLAGQSEIWMAGHGAGYWQNRGSQPDHLTIVWVSDVDTYHARVVRAGVAAETPEDRPYDVRCFTVTDPEGYQWMFARRTGKGFQASPGGWREIRRHPA